MNKFVVVAVVVVVTVAVVVVGGVVVIVVVVVVMLVLSLLKRVQPLTRYIPRIPSLKKSMMKEAGERKSQDVPDDGMEPHVATLQSLHGVVPKSDEEENAPECAGVVNVHPHY